MRPSHVDLPWWACPHMPGPAERCCGKRTISCKGSFCFLSQTGSRPQKRLKVLPFDPWEPGARRSLTAALRAGPQADLPFQTRSRPSGTAGSPRLPGTSSKIVLSGAPLQPLAAGGAAPGNGSEERVWPPTSVVQGKINVLGGEAQLQTPNCKILWA